MKDKENYNFPDDAGRYGEFGGKYVSETLMSALEELENTYENLKGNEEFKNEITEDLNNFVGRPSPLYFAKRLLSASNSFFKSPGVHLPEF